MARLIIMSGVPGSGKSTWAKKYADKHLGTVVVSRDAIRFSLVKEGEEYFSKEDLVVNTFLNSIVGELRFGHNVIADATHLSWKARNVLIERIKEVEARVGKFCDEIWVVSVNPGLAISMMRNDKRTGREFVPHFAITNMYKAQSDPKNDPFKYDKILYIRM